MADKTIGSLPNLTDISDDALLVVEFQGAAYHITGAQWKAYAIKAAQGVNKGEPGVSPIITVAEVDGGHLVTITDAEGTKSVVVENGEDGEPGRPGVSPTVLIETITGGHRVTISDITGTKSFDVLNGSDGSGSGDMLKSAYDPNETVRTAGGIVAYVNGIVGDINAALDEINGEVV